MGITAKAAALGALAWVISAGSTARAEFEIPQVDGEKGEIEVEYRGAQHKGPPAAADDGTIRQSHEVEFQYAIADWWMVRATPSIEQPLGENIQFVSVGLETQVVLRPRHGGTFGVALMLGYGPFSEFVNNDEPDEFEFGPIIELAHYRWLATLNPVLVEQIGNPRQQWFGLEYAAQLQYRFASHWSIAALAFGELEDLANAGQLSEQEHLFGSSLYWFSRAYRYTNSEESLDADRSAEWIVGVGALIGLTDHSNNLALRATASWQY